MLTRRGWTLAERTALTRAAQLPAGSGRTRHCWVTSPDDDGTELPGLVIEWQRRPEGWWARVVYLADDAGSVCVQAWVESRHLRPA